MITNLRFAILAISFYLTACEPCVTFNKNYFQKITGIELPAQYTVLESFDNAEWLTGVVIKLDSNDIYKLVEKYKFESENKDYRPSLLSNYYLLNYKLDVQRIKNLRYLQKSIGKHHWTCIADLDKSIFWMEVSYPDWAGQ